MSDEPTTDPVADELTVDVAAVSDGAYTLLVADFNDTDAAWEAYELLKSLEDGRHIELESVVVVKRGDDGQLEIQKAITRKTAFVIGYVELMGITDFTQDTGKGLVVVETHTFFTFEFPTLRSKLRNHPITYYVNTDTSVFIRRK